MRTLIFLAFASALLVRSAFGLEATFTPAEGQGAQDAGGPLPQSQNQRDQLLQLEDAILNSPNPQETLIEVAKANGMQPQDLVDLLQRNRADMEMAAGGGDRPEALTLGDLATSDSRDLYSPNSPNSALANSLSFRMTGRRAHPIQYVLEPAAY